MATSQFPDSYAGLSSTADGRLVLYTTDAASSASLRSQVSGMAASASVSIEMVQRPFSIAALNDLTDQIRQDWSELQKLGADLAVWGRDTESDKVIIHLQHYTPDLEKLLVYRYGAERVAVDHQDASTMTDVLSRTSDSAPWSGGDGVWHDDQAPSVNCSSGFGYKGKASGDAYMLSAGHCLGSTVYTNATAHYTMGPVTNIINGGSDGSRVDAETIRTTGGGDGRVIGKNTTYGIKGAFNPGTNYQYVTVSGAMTGEVNNARVYAQDQCVGTQPHIHPACHQSFIYKDGTTLCQPGDSGGPVFQRLPTGGAKAVGIIKATDGIGGCWYSQILDVLGAVNGQIITG
ncbi:MAG TPA: hypothetical protein VHC49_08480 [Mycobacteriales bacterium]|nr:hypothetical protein [Mycobacteriales bacterium]